MSSETLDVGRGAISPRARWLGALVLGGVCACAGATATADGAGRSRPATLEEALAILGHRSIRRVFDGNIVVVLADHSYFAALPKCAARSCATQFWSGARPVGDVRVERFVAETWLVTQNVEVNRLPLWGRERLGVVLDLGARRPQVSCEVPGSSRICNREWGGCYKTIVEVVPGASGAVFFRKETHWREGPGSDRTSRCFRTTVRSNEDCASTDVPCDTLPPLTSLHRRDSVR